MLLLERQCQINLNLKIGVTENTAGHYFLYFGFVEL
jgi:hypothetical protein